MRSINPYNGALLGVYEEHTPTEVENIVSKASLAFNNWRNTLWDERKKYLRNVSHLLNERVKELASLITIEMGKKIAESEAEIKKCAWVCDYYADNAEEFLKEKNLPVTEAHTYIAYDPLGVVLAIMPWNFPFWQVFRFAAPAVMAGNTGLLKHASNVPQCSRAISQLFTDAGFPEGVFQSLLISSKNTSHLISDRRIVAVTLTGSGDAGKSIAALAGQNIKKTVLELGGSDPYIVLKDADILKAAEVAAKARMINCGQSCIAAKRFIVQKEISQKFLDVLESKLGNLLPGDPMNKETGYGPMARFDLTEIIETQVADTLKKGATLILGGRRTDGFYNTFYRPTLLSEVKPGMAAFDEEIFGPVAAVTFVKDEEDAVKMANTSSFGLGASLWTEDLDKAARLARQIESGSVFINGMVASHPMVPFGGIKMSGYGRELSYLGIREFVNIKSVWINRSE